MDTSRSSQLFTQAQDYIPGGVNSPVRSFKSVGGTPLFIKRGQGSHIWDADGNEFEVPRDVLDADGNVFEVGTEVLDADGNPFTVLAVP